MNCKQGDLAIVVRSANPVNLGRILHLVKFIGDVEGWKGKDRWVFDDEKPLIGIFGGRSQTVQDLNLRPIRDNPGEDETLQWAPVPGQKVAA